MGRKSVHGQELPRHLWVSLLNPLAWISIWEASLSLVKRERGLNIKWMPSFARESSTSGSSASPPGAVLTANPQYARRHDIAARRAFFTARVAARERRAGAVGGKGGGGQSGERLRRWRR